MAKPSLHSNTTLSKTPSLSYFPWLTLIYDPKAREIIKASSVRNPMPSIMAQGWMIKN